MYTYAETTLDMNGIHRTYIFVTIVHLIEDSKRKSYCRAFIDAIKGMCRADYKYFKKKLTNTSSMPDKQQISPASTMSAGTRIKLSYSKSSFTFAARHRPSGVHTLENHKSHCQSSTPVTLRTLLLLINSSE